MLMIHPILQLIVTILSLVVLQQGIQRFRFQHLKQKSTFKWKRHVSMGTGILVLWLVGFAGGLMIVKNYWYTVFITGLHGNVGVTMVPFLLVGIVSGWIMHVKKRRRRILPLIHGANNLILLWLAFLQIYSGWQVLQAFVWGQG